MSDNAALPTPDRYATLQLGGTELVAVFRPDEGMAVPVRLVCEMLGLNLRSQSEKLRKHAVLMQGLRRDMVPLNGRMTEIVVILHKYIPFWLATISPEQVNDVARPKLVLYQTELVDLLAQLYLQRSGQQATPEQRQLGQLSAEIRQLIAAQQASEQRLERVETIIDDLEQHIPVTPAQAEYLLRTIKQLAARVEQRTQRKVYDMLFARFKSELGIPRYDALPAFKYEQALSWLGARAAEYFPDEPDALPPLQERML